MVRTGLMACLTGVWLAGAAQAGLEICNQTEELQSIAIGYKGETDWTSEGWWNIEPGKCAVMVGGDLTKRYYYYHADSKSDRFRGQDYIFCTQRDEFTIIGDTDCEDRGYQRAEFREIDTGETATTFTLTLVAQPVAPDSGGTGAKAPGSADETGGGDAGTQTVTETMVEPSVTNDVAALETGLPPGRSGTPFQKPALFQGCELEDGRAFCSFHSEGVKMRAFYKGPTPQDLFFALEEMAVNTPVIIEGDQVEKGGMQVAVVLRRVQPRPNSSDAHGELRRLLQGDWTLSSDRKSEVTIHGSEIFVRYNGEFRLTRFLQLADRCDASKSGPVLIQTSLRDRQPKCYRVARADGGVLDLVSVKGDERLRFLRAR